LIPFFDSAYQGFGTGDLEEDAWSIRYFIQQGFQMILSQSFAKNMGLYGERCGALHVVAHNKDTSEKVLSQIK
jgi:aspartate/tyrosine/aromatic aminotransferase